MGGVSAVRLPRYLLLGDKHSFSNIRNGVISWFYTGFMYYILNGKTFYRADTMVEKNTTYKLDLLKYMRHLQVCCLIYCNKSSLNIVLFVP